ncbi:MAG: 5-(carboxyamino)imidazole ribonucleotide synthase [Thiotrichales bacterium]
MIPPGATLGMLGGGQLGRMFLMAARNMGYEIVVFDPDPQSPAGRIADHHIQAAYDDVKALDELARRCAAVTTEFENIPAESLSYLAEKVAVHPSGDAVRVTQNRLREKNFVRECGLKTAEFAEIIAATDFDIVDGTIPFPAILKVAELGYDGKGQVVVESFDGLKAAFDALNQKPCVLEQRVDLAGEISVIMARNALGECSFFPIPENEHRGGILHRSIAPADIPDKMADDARSAAERIAFMLDYIGVLAVEFFITQSGELLVNEIAPRTHNSGHFTIDACLTSQFEQQVRAICGIDFADTSICTPVAMVNLLGDCWGAQEPGWTKVMNHSHTKLHLYGKTEPRPGRKMGHFSLLGDNPEALEFESEMLFKQLCHS